MLEKIKWSVVTRMHAIPRVQTEFWFGNILKWNEREGNKRKKQTDQIFYLFGKFWDFMSLSLASIGAGE